jgi:molecular chaperone IbpA
MSYFDLPSVHRHAIGFDRLFNELNGLLDNSKPSDGNYPPYNILKRAENSYLIEVAVAGFKESELDVEYVRGSLTITGKRDKTELQERDYLVRGLAFRDFQRRFTLSENMRINSAEVRDGILSIELENVVPEESRPKKIALTFK